eukprot:14222623-Heterocapsa_arctica.AAC.1
MNPSGTHDINTYNIHVCGRGAAEYTAALLGSLAAIEGSTGPGNAVFSWGPGDWKKAVFIPIPRGYIPVAVEAIRAASIAISLK